MGEPIKWETMREQTARLGRVGMWAPGSYISKCSACERQFEGDKRAMNCLPCAVSRLSSMADRATDEEALARVIRVARRAFTMADPETRGLQSPFVARAIIAHITTPGDTQ